MRVAELDGRRFAFELEWILLDVPASGKTAAQKAKHVAKFVHAHMTELAKVAGRRAFYTMRPMQGKMLVGFGYEPVGEKHSAKGLVSYAFALASGNDDGIYVCPSDVEGMLWYVVIQERVVVSGTDRCAETLQVEQTVESLSAELGLPVRVMTGLQIDLESEPFDPELAVKGTAAPAMLVASGKTRAGVDLAVRGAMLLAAVTGAYIWYSSGRQSEKELAEQQAAAEQKRAYASQVIQAVGDDFGAGPWLQQAVKAVYAAYPSHYHGWQLDTVACTRRQCMAKYKPSATGYSYSAMEARYLQTGGVRWDEREGVLVATTRLTPAPVKAALTEDDILGGGKFAGAGLPNRIEVEGNFLLKFPLTSAKNRSSVDLPTQYSAPQDVAPLQHESFVSEGAFYLSNDEAMSMERFMASARFDAATMEIRRRSATSEPSWTISWSRLKGAGQ